ncbi:hypothetical protein MVEN_00976000 [Mycena venus]|uniref:Uncharacterized protein n=1 Tax=Mycena venus TaxID=2733690 RepID=A0A8H6YCX2_9AGAR|nr:hypothetical protein MVEN_00976000 [Mycena venus]
MSCAYRTEPVVKRPKKVLTESEKEDAKFERAVNKMLKETRGEWEAALPKPWEEGATTFRHPAGTHVMFKSDAKKAFNLTEREVLTLPHESIPASPKTYFALADIRALQQRKFVAGALLDTDLKGQLRVLKSTTNTGRRCKANFVCLYDYGPNVCMGLTVS